MKTENYIWLGVTLAAIGLCVASFMNAFTFERTKLEEIHCRDSLTAYAEALNFLSVYPNKMCAKIVHTTGRSNAWDGKFKAGYVIVDTSFPYTMIESDIFVVRKDAPTNVLHRVRYREGDNWVMEGDGNQVADKDRLNRDNFVGLVVESKVWRY